MMRAKVGMRQMSQICRSRPSAPSAAGAFRFGASWMGSFANSRLHTPMTRLHATPHSSLVLTEHCAAKCAQTGTAHLTEATRKNTNRQPGMPATSTSPADRDVQSMNGSCAGQPQQTSHQGESKSSAPRLVANRDPSMPPTAPVRYSAPNALPLLALE